MSSSKYQETGKTARTAAFTLIELLVVMAISVILLGLLFGPIIQAFNVTNRTRAITSAQDAARFGLERITRELSQATFVFDNSVTPIVFPIGSGKTDRFGGANIDIASPAGYDATRGEVPFLFAKVDFVPAALGAGAASAAIDPTTGRPLGGQPLRFPLAPGTRLIRYFIGLRRNVVRAAGGGAPVAQTYQNPYEFRSDNGYNPFIVYRADFDPADPNLIDQSVARGSTQDVARNGGGLNDPNFFYNTKTAANGKSYGENWKAVASPFVSAANLDMIAWARNGGTQKMMDVKSIGLPFRPTAGFSPSAVVGDTATPGFLSDTGNANPNAVPSVYTAANGQWVLPYKVTLYRFSSRNNTADARYGTLSVVFRRNPDTGALEATHRAADGGGSSKSLLIPDAATDDADFTYRFSARGTVFVKTRNLTFEVDPLKGRIVTAFPPLAGDGAGRPLFDASGDPIQTALRMNTRRVLAGTESPLVPPATENIYPDNAGITSIYLAPEFTVDPEDTTLATRKSYYRLPLAGIVPDPTATGDSVSPFSTFGQGLLVIRGSERVLGPESDSAATQLLVPFFQIPEAAAYNRAIVTPEGVGTGSGGTYRGDGAAPTNYKLHVDDLDAARPRIDFDEPITDFTKTLPRGLPAARATDSADQQKEVQVTFFWQNNFARETDTAAPDFGYPVDARGNSVFDGDGGSIRPEPDAIKVDYSTRSLMNVRLGARVYDAASARPQSVEVSDRVKINNVGR